MRLALIATVALLPSAAFAQVGSQTLQASVSQPVAFVRASAPSSTPASAPAAEAPVAHFKDVVVKEQLSSPATDEILAGDGGLTYSFSGGGVSKSQIVAPVLVHTVGRTLPVAQAVSSSADVTLDLAVDAQGKPQNITVVHSAGAAIDKGTIEAVQDYRFKPATYHNTPIVAHVLLEVKIKK